MRAGQGLPPQPRDDHPPISYTALSLPPHTLSQASDAQQGSQRRGKHGFSRQDRARGGKCSLPRATSHVKCNLPRHPGELPPHPSPLLSPPPDPTRLISRGDGPAGGGIQGSNGEKTMGWHPNKARPGLPGRGREMEGGSSAWLRCVPGWGGPRKDGVEAVGEVWVWPGEQAQRDAGVRGTPGTVGRWGLVIGGLGGGGGSATLVCSSAIREHVRM